MPRNSPPEFTKGGWRDVWRLAIPIMISSVAGTANHLAGRYFLGQANDAAIEAILPAGMLAAILATTLSVVMGYSATFVAQYHGGGDGRNATSSFFQGLYLAAAAVPLFFITIPLGHRILELAGHAPAILAAEKSYFTLAQPAGALMMFTAVLSGIFTGQGKTRFVSIAAAAGSVANIALDRILVLGAGPVQAMGIRGASVALVASSAVPVILLAAAACRERLVLEHVPSGAAAPDGRLAARILAYGTPAGLTAFISGVTFTMFVLALGRVDEVSLAASNTVFAINNVYFLFICAIAGAVTILAGRYRGADDNEAVGRSMRSGLGIVMASLAVYAALLLPFSDFWAGFFSGKMPDAGRFLSICRTLFVIIAVRDIAEGVVCVAEGALRGVGDTAAALAIRGGCTLLLWAPAVAWLSLNDSSLVALWISSPVNLGIIAVLLLLRWRRGRWRSIDILVRDASGEPSGTPRS